MTTRMEMIKMNVDNYNYSLCEISHSHRGGGYDQFVSNSQVHKINTRQTFDLYIQQT